MKSGRIFVFLACLLSLGICAVANAADEEGEGAAPMGKMQTILSSNHYGEDWGYALGLKAWMNEWSLPVKMNSYLKKHGASLLQFESDSEFAFIPTFMIRYRNFFIGGSYMPETDYQFSTQSVPFTAIFYNNTIIGLADTNVEVSAERKEWDLNVGYMITPNIALSIGYKSLDRSYDIEKSVTAMDIYGNISNFAYDIDIDIPVLDESLNAPILGLSAVFPVKGKLNLYNNLAYGWIGGDADGYYYLGEVGVNYVIPLKKVVSAIIINLGYRWQRLDLDYNYSAGDQNDTTSGFNLGVTAAF